MKQLPLSPEDMLLVKAASDAAMKPAWQLHGDQTASWVASAARMDDGEILTAVCLIADVGSLGVCAETQIVGRANQITHTKIKTIVAVHYDQNPAVPPKVISPCGRCRELITDYTPDAAVILRSPGAETLFKSSASELLPFKYGDYWQGGKLV